MRCGARGAFWCDLCHEEYEAVLREVAGLTELLGSEYSEGELVSAGQRLLREDLEPGLTDVSRVGILERAHTWLAAVEDHFRYTPTCVVCGEHKMILIAGDQPGVTCTGGCEYGR